MGKLSLGGLLLTMLLGMACSGGMMLIAAFFSWLEETVPAPARPAYRAWLLGQAHPDLNIGADRLEGRVPYLGGVCVPERLPVAGPISLDFGEIYGDAAPRELRGRRHSGIDIAVPEGLPVISPISGRVVFADYDVGWPSYGNLVIICNGPVCVYLAHLSQIGVAAGQEISAGATVGLSGNTGTSTGPHVHYEVRVSGVPVDPRVLDPVAQACAEAARGGGGGQGRGGGGDAWLIRRAPGTDSQVGWLRHHGPPAMIFPEGASDQAVSLRAGEAVTVSMPITFEIRPARPGGMPLQVRVAPGEVVDILPGGSNGD